MLRRIRIMIVLLLICLGLLVASCATHEQSAGLGAMIGGVTGALIGERMDNPWLGGAVGAALGAAVAYAVHEYSRQSRSAQQTVRDYSYKPVQGFRMEVKNVAVTPKVVNPGNTVTATSEYAVLGSGEDGVRVTESTLLKQNDQVLTTLSEKRVTRSDGTWEGILEFQVPPDVKAGRYVITRQVAAEGVTRHKQSNFLVQSAASVIVIEPGLAMVKGEDVYR